ncbi:MAG: hypothetical protein IPI79_13740 [Moraxellaceae bacterium]|nr:hypothetical protein [Moraxellaceae bacterium]
MATPFWFVCLTLDDISTRFATGFEGLLMPVKARTSITVLTDAALSAFSVFFTQSPSFEFFSEP